MSQVDNPPQGWGRRSPNTYTIENFSGVDGLTLTHSGINSRGEYRNPVLGYKGRVTYSPEGFIAEGRLRERAMAIQ
jgi:hypothetical protein